MARKVDFLRLLCWLTEDTTFIGTYATTSLSIFNSYVVVRCIRVHYQQLEIDYLDLNTLSSFLNALKPVD
jgi:hypothetical protein